MEFAGELSILGGLMQIIQHTTLALLLGSLVLFASPSNAADCPTGETRQEHHVGNFNFVTNSWVEESGKLRRYVSCVGNFDRDSDLLVTWHVAGPTGTYVPSDDVATERRMSNDLNPRPVNGCIKYGNLGDYAGAQFIGSAADEDENAKDNPCTVANTLGGPELAKPGIPEDGYSDQVRVFFPSNPDKPRETMLEINGVIGISPIDGAFESFFTYSAQKYKDRPDGNPDAIRVRPIFVTAPESYYKAFFDYNKEITPLGSKGNIVFTVFHSNTNLVPATAFYEFISSDNRVVGSIPMPIFGPEQ
ncbi:hypothetical protein [Mesorhizobium sp. M0633]|uniref:hypothetical protein n=1 Tax=Mesorhizobium sp. M0633 TaxID=2956977 RepID=UPI003339AB8D